MWLKSKVVTCSRDGVVEVADIILNDERLKQVAKFRYDSEARGVCATLWEKVR